MRAIFLKERGGLNGFSIFATRRNGSPFPPSLSLSLSLWIETHTRVGCYSREKRVSTYTRCIPLGHRRRWLIPIRITVTPDHPQFYHPPSRKDSNFLLP